MGDTVGSEWPNEKTAAISLTFDGGLAEHYELVAPILEEHEVRGTFFVTVPQILENPDAWRRLASKGHEIGSHSLMDVAENGRLTSWTLDMVQEDLLMTDRGIVEIIGQPVTSFAKPGTLTEASDGDYEPILRRQFSYLRGFEPTPNRIQEVDFTNVGSVFWPNLVGPIESVVPDPLHWSVVVFEGFFNLENAAAEDDLRVLLGHLQRHAHVWVAPFSEIASAIANSKKATLG